MASTAATASVTIPELQRSGLVREQKVVPISLSALKVWNALHTNLPGTASADDAALITGTPGTDAPTVQGQDSGGTSTSSKFAFEFELPAEYVAGDEVKIRAKGIMLTTVADDEATIDFECYKDARDGSVGSDLVTTAAQDINSLTAKQWDFVVTPTGLTAGDKLIVVGTIAVTDAGDAGVMTPELQALEMVLYVQG